MKIGLYWPDEKIKQKCDIPSSFMIIEGDGMVLPCNAVEYNRDKIIGNVFETDIEKLWNSLEWNMFRKDKMNFCRECPMNMSYMLVFNDNKIERECSIVHHYTSEEIKNIIKIDQDKEYIEERLEEYLNFFEEDIDFIKQINEKYKIDSLEYKINFLYPNFFNNMNSNIDIFDSYNNASKYYSMRQLLGRPEKFEGQLEIFDFMKTNLNENSIVLDYGCCVGDFSILFAKMGYKVYAFDLDIYTFDFAIKRFDDRKLNIKPFKIANNMKIPKINEKVDFIFCRDVLEHTVNPLDVLEYFYDNLSVNGYMYISTMNPGEDIYIGAEHLEQTILLAKTKEYKEFFNKHFINVGIHGLYKKKI